MSDDTGNITAREAHDAGFCIKGQREWFPSVGLDFKEHMRNGTPAGILYEKFPAAVDRILDLRRAKRG